MQFNDVYFLFLFLPIFLIIYYLTSPQYKNIVVLIASIIFFAWVQPHYFVFMVLFITINFYLGKKIEKLRNDPEKSRNSLWFGIVFNILALLCFKVISFYGINWYLEKQHLDQMLIPHIKTILIPLGLSYISFQFIAYQTDIYKKIINSEKNFINFSLYIFFFPKIVSGPITRFRDFYGQIKRPEISVDDAAEGARRFIVGFAKKALLADQLARIVDPAFSLQTPNFSSGIAWVVLIGYAFQLYFDFSGYTDMAIGLAKMIGYSLPENFIFPYISRSISEFWRRWHITLSSWFRNYLFYPLEFSSRLPRALRQKTNILIVFLITGLWHGLTINFLIWGFIHGIAIVMEVTFLSRWLQRVWKPVSHFYTIFIILTGWVFFRSPSLTYALQMLARLAGVQPSGEVESFSKVQNLILIDNSIWVVLLLSVIFSIPIFPMVKVRFIKLFNQSTAFSFPLKISNDVLMIMLLILSVAATNATSLSASIYGGF